jgi:betaine-aldehyde dehydrogenase
MNVHAQLNLVELPEHRDLYYGGGWHVPAKNKRVGSVNPATGESLGEVGWGDSEDVDRAVKAAYSGFLTGPQARPRTCLDRLRELRKSDPGNGA